MDRPQSIAGTLSVIPDVLDSLAATADNLRQGELNASTVQASPVALVFRLSDAVELVREILDSDSEKIHEQIPPILDDGIECCRLLASALNYAPPNRPRIQQRQPSSGQKPEAQDFPTIASRVAASLERLCDIAQLKNEVLQEKVLRQGQARKAIRQLDADYEALALLVHQPAANDQKDRGSSQSRQAATDIAPPASQGLSVSDAFRWCRELLFTDEATRRSQAIDRQLLQDPQPPWSISAVLTTGWYDATKPLLYSLRSHTCAGKQDYLEQLRERAATYIGQLLRTALDKPALPDPLKEEIQTLQARLNNTGGVFTDEVLKGFEGLWRSPDLHVFNDSWSAARPLNRVLGHLREIIREDYTMTAADVAFTLALQRSSTSTVSLVRGEKRIDMYQRICGSSAMKRWGLYLGSDLPVVAHIVDLSQYDLKDEDAGHDAHFLGQSLLFFKTTLGSNGLVSTTVLLFLTNYSAFAERLKTVALSRQFPEYGGGDDAKQGAAFIRDKFLEVGRRFARRHRIRTRICDILDAENVDFIFTSMEHAMRWRNIHDMKRRQARGLS